MKKEAEATLPSVHRYRRELGGGGRAESHRKTTGMSPWTLNSMEQGPWETEIVYSELIDLIAEDGDNTLA